MTLRQNWNCSMISHLHLRIRKARGTCLLYRTASDLARSSCKVCYLRLSFSSVQYSKPRYQRRIFNVSARLAQNTSKDPENRGSSKTLEAWHRWPVRWHIYSAFSLQRVLPHVPQHFTAEHFTIRSSLCHLPYDDTSQLRTVPPFFLCLVPRLPMRIAAELPTHATIARDARRRQEPMEPSSDPLTDTWRSAMAPLPAISVEGGAENQNVDTQMGL